MSFESSDSYTEELFASYRHSTDTEVEHALATADTTFGENWNTRSSADRAAVVGRVNSSAVLVGRPKPIE